LGGEFEFRCPFKIRFGFFVAEKKGDFSFFVNEKSPFCFYHLIGHILVVNNMAPKRKAQPKEVAPVAQPEVMYNLSSKLAQAPAPVVFDAEMIACIGTIMKRTVLNANDAIALRIMWEDGLIISVGATYESVNNNIPVVRLLTSTLGNGLDKIITANSFSPHFPDWQLYNNGRTDKLLGALILEKAKHLTKVQIDEVTLKRNNLVALVNRTRRNIILDMELACTPDGSKKKLKTGKEVNAEVYSNAKDAQDANGDGEDDEEGADGEPLTESSSSSSSSSSIRTTSKNVTDAIVACFPELKDGAHVELVDGQLRLVV
jgi:hypothetical protein